MKSLLFKMLDLVDEEKNPHSNLEFQNWVFSKLWKVLAHFGLEREYFEAHGFIIE